MYALDTSGLSNPYETMPPDMSAYKLIWDFIEEQIRQNRFLVTEEIFNELLKIEYPALKNSLGFVKKEIIYDADDLRLKYVELTEKYHGFIDGLGIQSKGTVSTIDIGIIALGALKSIPVISMEVSVGLSPQKKRIPDVCFSEGVEHLTFNDFLKRECR